jgi:predicted  nucleic acid-binding Zn-ribbon protein
MEELTGVIRSLEKENAVLLEKERKSQELLSAMRAEHSGQLSDISRGEQQITRLQSLIMKLEQDNQALESQLKGVTSETPSDNVTVVQSS